MIDKPQGGGPWTTERAFAYCQAFAAQHNKDFPVAAKLLNQRIRRHVATIYTLIMMLTEIADLPETESERLTKIAAFDHALQDAARGRAEHPLFIALAETLDLFSMPVSFLSDLVAAAKIDVSVRRYTTFDALLRYCEKAARPVGRILLTMGRDQDPDHWRCADDLSTALLLASFWSTVGQHYQANRIYLPEEDRLRFGVSEADLKQKRATKEMRALMEFEVARARVYLLRGAPLCQRAPKEIRTELKKLWLAGDAMLAAQQRRGYDLWNKRAKISKRDQVRAAAHLVAWQVRDFTQW